MKCDDFWKIFHGKGMTPELEKHLESCGSCRNEMEINELLDEKIRDFPSYQAPESLWNKINEKLDEDTFIRHDTESKTDLRMKIVNLRKKINLKYVVAAAAMIVFIVLAGQNYSYFTGSNEAPEEIQAALTNIEEAEKDYIAAIDRFNTVISDKKEALAGNSLYQLYQEKLAMLDDFIIECKEALEQNKLNINVRKYLMLAYKDKVETLEAISKLI
ncbi:MAG: hypothetical protein GY863_00300 [bacterium]|nr:hypothetical protein [bacterium]